MNQRVRVKICGVRSEEDVVAAVAAGADAVGFNFYPQSPRFIDPNTAAELARRLPPFVEAVGVFVRTSVEAARRALAGTAIRVIQVHGGEPELIERGLWRYVPAFAARDEGDLAGVKDYLARCRAAGAPPSAVLVDGHAPGLHGGTGVAAPWELLAEWAEDVPLILAGGLTPENVAEAARRVRPYAVDVAGGVEASPGHKDADKIRRFVEAVRGA